MARRKPNFSPELENAIKDPQSNLLEPLTGRNRIVAGQPVEYVTQVREYELITPLFGGGVEPGVVDSVTPISGKGIRGQLRFWWRAMVSGAMRSDLNLIARREKALWGAASSDGRNSASAVHVEMRVLDPGTNHESYDTRRNTYGNPLHVGHPMARDGYAGFPLRKEHHKKTIIGICFELTITYPKKVHSQVDNTLWAWETFGGVGARTRRGFGAIQSIDSPALDSRQAVLDYLDREFKARFAGWKGRPDNVPALLRWKVLNESSDSVESWRDLMDRLKAFRQKRVGGRPQGKTLWPEADGIRELYDTGATTALFPRSHLGLPVNFEFKDEPHLNGVLKTSNWERLASPLVLRPFKLQNGEAVGIVLILLASDIVPPNLEYHFETMPPGQARRNFPVSGIISASSASGINNPLAGKTDAVEAFFESF